MPSWFDTFTLKDRRTFWACFTGYAADSMDVHLYPFVMPVLMGLWSISKTDAGILATAPMIFSAFGGWIAGILADRFGRARLLQITILWFAVFTFLSGAAQNFEQLLVIRCLQGLGFGGEWAVGSILIGEAVQSRYRGRVMGSIQSAWAVGWGAATVLATLLFTQLPEAIAWRVLFFAGLLPALVALYVRRSVSESSVFLKARGTTRDAHPSVFAIFGRPYRAATFYACLLAAGAHGGYYTIAIWLPTYLRTERQLSFIGTGAFTSIIILGAFCGYMVASYLVDTAGKRITFLMFAIFSGVLALLYTQLPIPNAASAALGFPLGFFAAGLYSGLGPWMSELFSTELRAAGQGFCYNFGRALGSIFPVLVAASWLDVPLGRSIGMLATAAFSLVIIGALALPETRGMPQESALPTGHPLPDSPG
ncbi:MFS transporter [Steroidobacter agaridevorans]|uniref:MFS transporter n=1 Tax=Steroidobacter agaridevorans TaxID=2695856 RepID=A0A829YGC6_9GAMM|nr:MFS transporter [Steroidobacter agaridevorans]GFE81861.1 MFS transporter [Steroidobacter agaridevorans]